MSEAEQRSRVCEIAREYVGTPYHHHGKIKGVGVDCATLLIKVFSDAGLIEDYQPGNYSTKWFLHAHGEELYLEQLLKFARPINTEAPAPADIVMFHVGHKWAHGGIVLDWPLIVHAYRPDGIVRLAEADKAEFSDTTKYPRRFYRLSAWG